MTFSPNQPLLDIAGLGREVHADLEDLPIVSGERWGVAFLLDLPQGLLGGSVELELHDIYIAIGLQDEVYTPVRGMVLHLRVQADQLEDDEEDVPVMQLRVSLRLLPGDHLVGCVGEEALEAVEESVVIARPYLPNELSDLEGGLRGLYARIERK